MITRKCLLIEELATGYQVAEVKESLSAGDEPATREAVTVAGLTTELDLIRWMVARLGLDRAAVIEHLDMPALRVSRQPDESEKTGILRRGFRAISGGA